MDAPWITIQPRFDDVVVSTYGRGIWILDDISSLQQLTASVTASSVYLFPLRSAYRFLIRPTLPMYMGEADDPPTLAGQNPPYGADLTYYLDKSPSAGTKAQIRIVDSGDEVIRTLTGTTNRGINRVWWDLRYDSSKVPRLLTKPSGATWFRMGADGTRDFPVEAKLAPTVAPGDYTVELNVGTTRVSRPLVVLKDPHSSATQQQIAAQTKMGLELRDLADTMSSIIDEAESARAQILGLEAVLKTENRWKSVESEAEALDSKLLSIEEAFLPGHDRGIR